MKLTRKQAIIDLIGNEWVGEKIRSNPSDVVDHWSEYMWSLKLDKKISNSQYDTWKMPTKKEIEDLCKEEKEIKDLIQKQINSLDFD